MAAAGRLIKQLYKDFGQPLVDEVVSALGRDADPEMVKKFRIYHAENPAIYRAFTRFTFHAIRAGRDKLGANMVIERIRWESMISGAATDGFKINNNYAPFYSRMFMSDFPENSELFRTRKNRRK